MIHVVEPGNGEVGEYRGAGNRIDGTGLDTDIAELVIVELPQGASCRMNGTDLFPCRAKRGQEPLGRGGTACRRCDEVGLTFGFENRPDRGMIVYRVSSSQALTACRRPLMRGTLL